MNKDISLNAYVPNEEFILNPKSSGTLNGLKFAVKDLFNIKGHVTGAGNIAWKEQHSISESNAPVIDMLLNEGAICTGKTITDEMAFSLDGENAHYGSPHNPNCEDCITGGSSSGSVSLVANKVVDFALGTDTAGSIRVPASFCGVYGFRPTHNLISTEGVHPLSKSFDVVGWFTTNSDTLEKVGNSLIKDKQNIVNFNDIILCSDLFNMVDSKYKLAFKKIIENLNRANYNIETVSIFNDKPENIVEILRTIQWKEFNEVHGEWIVANIDSFGEEIRGRIKNIGTVTELDYIREKKNQEIFINKIENLLLENKVIIFPTINDKAPKKGRTIKDARNYRSKFMNYICLSTVTGLPQVSIPIKNNINFPMGLSILAPRNYDKSLLSFVKSIESLL